MISLWWHASRPGSLVKVLLPLGAGLSLGAAATGQARTGMVAGALLYGWLVQLLIIFLNDYADAEADTIHTRRYGSLIDQRAVPHGWLRKEALLKAGALVLALMLLLTGVLAIGFSRPWAPLFALGSVGLLWAYSFPPIGLNYRGLGELLETAGVGAVLPWAGFYFYTGRLEAPLAAFAPLIPLALASALSSGLKHMPADRLTGKRTVAVLLGQRAASTAGVFCLVIGLALCVMLAATGVHHPVALSLTVIVPAWFTITAFRHAGRADHRHLAALKTYKGALHRAIYAVTLGVIASGLVQYLTATSA